MVSIFLRTFAPANTKPRFPSRNWRDGRVVDYSSLENYRTERYRGFESLSLRNLKKEVRFELLFLFYILNRQKYRKALCLIDKNSKNTALIRQKYPKTLCLFDKNT